MIGYWHHHVVRPSVRPDALWLSWSVRRVKSYLPAYFLAGKFLIVHSYTFVVGLGCIV